MDQTIILTQVQFTDLIEEVAKVVRTELESIPNTSAPEELLTRVQAAELLSVTLPTLREYTKKGLITGYRMGSRVRYKRSEILDSLQKIRTTRSV